MYQFVYWRFSVAPPKSVGGKASKKNLRICAGRCNQENFLMFTHQYLWDLDCSKAALRATIG